MKNVMIYPGKGTWITPRSTEIQLTTDNMVLLMPKPIAELVKIVLSAENSAKIAFTPTAGSGFVVKVTQITTVANDNTTALRELDLTNYFVEKAKYNTLMVRGALDTRTGENSKNNTSYWTRNENEIKLCTQRANLFSSEPLLEAVEWTLNNMLKTQNLYVNGIQVASFGLAEADGALLDWRYRVEFIPLGETTRLNVLKNGAKGAEYSIPYSQQQQIATTVGLGRNMQSTANRMGAEVRKVVRTLQNDSELRKVGTVCEENGVLWRLTDVEMTCTNSRLIVTETWSKNWSVRSQFVGVNREFRTWNIPSETVERNLLWEDYAVISLRDVDDDKVLISDGAKDVLTKYIDGTAVSGETEISTLWIDQADGKNGGICSVSAFGFGNSLVFSAKTQDNLSVGVKRQQLDSNDTHWTECIDVYYTDENGELASASLSMAATIDNVVSDVYPEHSTTGSLEVNKIGESGTVLFKNKVLAIDKDSAEQLNFTYQLHVLTDRPEILIGTALASGNQLVKQYTPTFKSWKLTKKLPQGAQTMTTDYGTETTAAVVAVTKKSGGGYLLTFGNSDNGVVLTDENNNIIIARNKGGIGSYNIGFTHDYKTAIGG